MKIIGNIHTAPSDSPETIEAEIIFNERGISIGFDGYGDKTTDGRGTPIYIELHNGVPKIYIWGDINYDDPTLIISLEGAALSNRKE